MNKEFTLTVTKYRVRVRVGVRVRVNKKNKKTRDNYIRSYDDRDGKLHLDLIYLEFKASSLT
jgi:hypothetical protein